MCFYLIFATLYSTQLQQYRGHSHNFIIQYVFTNYTSKTHMIYIVHLHNVFTRDRAKHAHVHNRALFKYTELQINNNLASTW